MLDIKVLRKRQTNYPLVFKAINSRFLPEAGIMVLDEAIRGVPVKDGYLKGSLKYKVNLIKDQAVVGSRIKYAPYVEYGTKKMKARPYLRPALDVNRKRLVKRWADIYSKLFAVLGGKRG